MTGGSPKSPEFLEAGSSGPMVVLVHSSLSGARQWRRLMDDLNDDSGSALLISMDLTRPELINPIVVSFLTEAASNLG